MTDIFYPILAMTESASSPTFCQRIISRELNLMPKAFFDGNHQLDVAERVPFGDVVGSGCVINVHRIQVEYFAHDCAKARINIFSCHNYLVFNEFNESNLPSPKVADRFSSKRRGRGGREQRNPSFLFQVSGRGSGIVCPITDVIRPGAA